jgi:hypothetical protein
MSAESRSLVAIAGATLLGVAVYTQMHWLAVTLLVPTIALVALAALGSNWSPKRDEGEVSRAVQLVAYGTGVILFAGSFYRALDLGVTWQLVLFVLGSTAICGTGYAVVVMRRGSFAFSLFVGAFLTVIISVLSITPNVFGLTDVAVFQNDASVALSEGINPYSIRFPDIYGDRSDVFYGPGVSEDGILQFGYPYLPLSLLVVAPFQLVFGDFRIAHALAIIFAAVIMSRIRPGKNSQSTAVLFLLISPVFSVMVYAWIEPILILGAALVVFAASRRIASTSYWAGALLALKQYGVLLAPATLLLLERPWKPRTVIVHFAKMAAVIAVTVLPFFLWGPGDFTWSVVELQFVQPFRGDSISFLALWAAIAGEPSRMVGWSMPFVVVGLVTLSIWKRSPSGAQGLSLAAALTLLVAFAFSKQAFVNYYILVIGLLFLGAAAGQRTESNEAAPATALVDAAGAG